MKPNRYWPKPRKGDEARMQKIISVIYYACLENSFHGLEFPWCTGWQTLGTYCPKENLECLRAVQAYIYAHLGVTVSEYFIWRAEATDLAKHIYDLMRMTAIARELRVKHK